MSSAAHELPQVVADALSAMEALVEFDPSSLDDADLEAVMPVVERVRMLAAVASADVLVPWDERRLYESNGSLTPAHRYAKETRSSVPTGRAEVRRARFFASLQHTRGEVLAGRISWDLVDLLRRAAGGKRKALFVRDEELLVSTCSDLPFFDAEVVVKRWMSNANDVLAREHNNGDLPEPPSRVFASRTKDDRVAITGDLDAIDGEIFTNELDRLVDEQKAADKQAGIERTPAERRARALIEMAIRSRTAPADGRRPQPLFTAIIGSKTMDDLCELENSRSQVSKQSLLPYLTTGMIESVLFDGPTTIIGVTHQRSVQRALRRAINVRDRRCQHPSECDTPATKCDAGHIKPFAKGGSTSQANLRPECNPHNQVERLHGPNATDEPPGRGVSVLDAWRARLRWQIEHEDPEKERRREELRAEYLRQLELLDAS